MHQELDAYDQPCIWGHVERLVDPRLRVRGRMLDGDEDGTVVVGDVSILPVEGDAVNGTGPVPI